MKIAPLVNVRELVMVCGISLLLRRWQADVGDMSTSLFEAPSSKPSTPLHFTVGMTTM